MRLFHCRHAGILPRRTTFTQPSQRQNATVNGHCPCEISTEFGGEYRASVRRQERKGAGGGRVGGFCLPWERQSAASVTRWAISNSRWLAGIEQECGEPLEVCGDGGGMVLP